METILIEFHVPYIVDSHLRPLLQDLRESLNVVLMVPDSFREINSFQEMLDADSSTSSIDVIYYPSSTSAKSSEILKFFKRVKPEIRERSIDALLLHGSASLINRLILQSIEPCRRFGWYPSNPLLAQQRAFTDCFLATGDAYQALLQIHTAYKSKRHRRANAPFGALAAIRTVQLSITNSLRELVTFGIMPALFGFRPMRVSLQERKGTFGSGRFDRVFVHSWLAQEIEASLSPGVTVVMCQHPGHVDPSVAQPICVATTLLLWGGDHDLYSLPEIIRVMSRLPPQKRVDVKTHPNATDESLEFLLAGLLRAGIICEQRPRGEVLAHTLGAGYERVIGTASTGLFDAVELSPNSSVLGVWPLRLWPPQPNAWPNDDLPEPYIRMGEMFPGESGITWLLPRGDTREQPTARAGARGSIEHIKLSNAIASAMSEVFTP